MFRAIDPAHHRTMLGIRPARHRRRSLASLGLALVIAVGCGPGPSPSPSPSPVVSPSPSPVVSPSPSPSPLPSPSPSPSPSVVAADLDGLLVAPEFAHRLPLAVAIDDNRTARQQSGFNAASLVYQSLADGYESRYLFVYQSTDAPDIGPVRSGRLFLAQWAAEYRAGFAHFGGDKQTLRWTKAGADGLLTDLDALFGSAAAFHRIRERPKPHNAYTSTAALWRQVRHLDGSREIAPAAYRPTFRDESPLVERAAAQTIRIPYRTVRIDFAFDRATNAYRRSTDGVPQMDPADGQRVTARNVVVLFMPFRIDTKIEPGHSRPVIGTMGEGDAWVFSEGRLTKGRWARKDVDSPTLVVDRSGAEIALVRGRTFIQVVPLGTKVVVGS
jgi:hypothetical protein